MTGDELKKIRLSANLTLRGLGKRWGVSRTTIQDEEKKDKVRGLYADAARYLRRKKNLVNESNESTRKAGGDD